MRGRSARIGIRPPRALNAGGVREREAEQIFDFGKRQNDSVRVSIVQIFI
jgi:hypothetical protein